MTRRVIAFRDGTEFRISQEFNGDKDEIRQFWRESPTLAPWSCQANWSDIVDLFDGVEDDDFTAFAEKVKVAESLYGYSNDPLWLVTNEQALLAESEEIWLLQGKRLVLYAKYGDREWPAIKATNEGAAWITESGEFCENYSRDMLKYADGLCVESDDDFKTLLSFFREQKELPGWKQLGFNGCWSCDRAISCERFQKFIADNIASRY